MNDSTGRTPKRRQLQRFLTAALLGFAGLFYSLAAFAGLLVSGERGDFVFNGDAQFADKPVVVYYYKPKTVTADTRVVFAIHGVDRSGKRARDNWLPFSEKYGLIVLAPEFDDMHYPPHLFQLGGMEKDKASWTFPIIEKIFDKVRNEENLSTNSYILFGHSAGGQFAHRFVMMMDNPRVSVAIAANAGNYTMPVYPTSIFDHRFPWALDESVLDTAHLKAAFGRKLIVLLGENDIQTEASNTIMARESLAQGRTRLERGKSFYAKAKDQAEKMHTPFEWKLVTVPGVGHNSKEMSKAAAKMLFDAN
jgi:hypothetical protein